MPRITQKKARELLHRKLGEPQNELDKHVFNQLVKLAGKKVVIQYGVHLGENPGRFAALLVRKKLEGEKKVGFLEFNAPMGPYRVNAVWKAVPKAIKHKVTDKHIAMAEKRLVENGLIHSRRYNRDLIQQAVAEILKPNHYIDIHATNRHAFDPPMSENKFILGLLYEDHFKVLETMYKKTHELLDPGHKETLMFMPSFADIAVEVMGNSVEPQKPRRVKKFYEDTHKQYATVQPLDELGKRNARATAKFLERYVKRLVDLKQRGPRKRPTVYDWNKDGPFTKRKKLKG